MADMLMTPVSPGTLPLRMLAKRQYARGQQMVEEERGRRLDAELARRRNQGGAPAAATNQDRQQTEYLREMTQLQRAELEWQQQVQALYRDNQRFTTVQNLN
jgi:hypothetical protein